jgi:hypothetical protein
MRTRLIGLACAATLLVLPLAAVAQQKSAKQCNDEWRANRATIQASGKLKRDFVAECRGNAKAAARTAPPQQPASAPSAPPQGQAATPPPSRAAAPAARPGTVGVGSSPEQHANEAQAKASCAGDAVVWVNLRSKIYHFSKAKAYGNTKNGTYMCERDTARAGFRAARNEKRP